VLLLLAKNCTNHVEGEDTKSALPLIILIADALLAVTALPTR